jgi:hypothetical protein
LIRDLVRSQLLSFDAAVLEPFLTELTREVSHRAEAILAYGSCLSDVTRSETSTPDFFVLVRSYGAFHGSHLHALLNRVLPPSIYHFAVAGRTAKYNVVSLAHFARETSERARDCYILGRISKRIALVWAKDPAVVEAVVDAQARAAEAVARRARSAIPSPFTVEALSKAALALSYAADVRVEAGDKVDRLFAANREFYLRLYGHLLDRMCDAGEVRARPDGGGFESSATAADRLALRWFLSKSQIRAQLRWPKGIFTVKGWIDYLIAKIERTQGIRIEMTERQKRLWYIYGWKHFLSLRRNKLIK